MNDRDRDTVDPRLDRMLERAAEVERRRPSPSSHRFLGRLRPRLRVVRASVDSAGGWTIMTQAAASLAAAGILAATLFFVFRQPPYPAAPVSTAHHEATTPGDLEDDPEDVFLVDNLAAFERLAELLADEVSAGDFDAIEVCDDLDLLQDADLDAILADLLEETG